jgi:SAM-dependent methyltransferase
LLDLGCGSGAFVDVCRKSGIEAYGCELVRYHYAPENEHVYYRKFEDIHFPTDYFQRVICCDVLEHVLDPMQFLIELFRVTDIGGICYIEIPLFFHKDAGPHWKRTEHIWYFTPEQLEALLIKIGFNVVGWVNTEDTKIMFFVTKPKQNRIKLLVPPGIGDVYWPLIKTESLLKREGITPPVDVYVACPRAKMYNSHARAFPYLEMIPFLHSTGEVRYNSDGDPLWKEAYTKQGRTVFRDVLGCDYFITWNGYTRAGKTLESVDPDLKCNWDLPRFISLNEEKYKKDSIKKYGNYVVFYWPLAGTSIFKHVSIEQIADGCNQIAKQTKCTPLLVGAIWDKNNPNIDKLYSLLLKDTIDLRGKTTVEEIFGLMRGSRAVVGMNSGITIMSGVFGVKTILLYHDYLFTGGVDRSFAWNTFPPYVRNKTYFPEFADKVTMEGFSSKAVSIIKDVPYIEDKAHIRTSTETPSVEISDGKQPLIPSVRVENIAEQKPWQPRPDDMLRWRKVGGGSIRLRNGTLAKPNQIFVARQEEIPEGFRDAVKLLGPA